MWRTAYVSPSLKAILLSNWNPVNCLESKGFVLRLFRDLNCQDSQSFLPIPECFVDLGFQGWQTASKEHCFLSLWKPCNPLWPLGIQLLSGALEALHDLQTMPFLCVVELNYSYHWLSLSLSLCASLHGGMYSSFIALGVDATTLNQHEKLGLEGLSALDIFGK